MLLTPLLLLPAFFLSLTSTSASSLSPKTQKLHDLARSSKSGIVILDSPLYDEFVEGPRDYSITVLLTAMGKEFKCGPCHQFAPEHEALSKFWSKKWGSQKDEHFFALLDFADGQATYQKLGLSSAPTLQLFRPTEGERASNKGVETYDFGRSGFKAEAFSSWLSSNAELPIDFRRPIDTMKVIYTGALGAVALFMVYYAGETVLMLVSHKILWAGLCIFIIITMNAGYMWNQIRHPPYSQPSNGGISYIAGGYSNQYGAETQIIGTVYAILAFAAYTLVHLIPKLEDPMRQRLGVYVWTGISVIMMGVLMNIFTIKQGGYPFKLF